MGKRSMHVAHLSKIVLVFVLSNFVILAAADAAEVRTYRFDSDQPRLLHFAGGLIGYDTSAQLAGSFDIEIGDGGAAAITRFDVQLHDIVNQGSADPGWAEGQSLAPILFNNPVGLTGTANPTSILLGFPPDPDVILWQGPLTTFALTPSNGSSARLYIRSVPFAFIDNPSLMAESPGFLVQLVPEPSAWTIALFGAIAAITKTRNRREFR
jgi:hypothetical protein